MLQTNDSADNIARDLRFSFEIDKTFELDLKTLHTKDKDCVIVHTPKVLSTIYKMLMVTGNFHLSLGEYISASTYYKYAVRICDQAHTDISVCGGPGVIIKKRWLQRSRAARFIYLRTIKNVGVEKLDSADITILNMWQ